MRSASRSNSRVKPICAVIALACPMAAAAEPSWELRARIASAIAASIAIDICPSLAHHARHVVLGHVRDFVRQHRGQFRFALRGDDQSGMHADVAARQREGVERGILDQEELEILAHVLAVGHQAVAEGVEILGDFGIVGKGRDRAGGCRA